MPSPQTNGLARIRETLAPLIQRDGVRATARAVGVHHSMLINFTAGRRDIPVGVLLKLASRFRLVLELKDAREDSPPISTIVVRSARGNSAGRPAR